MSLSPIDKILNFINSTETQEPQIETPKNEIQEPQTNKQEIKESPPIENINLTTKEYNSIMRKINKNKSFPVVIANKVFNTPDELTLYKSSIIDNRKQFLKQERLNKKTNTKLNLNELPIKEDTTDLIEEDGFYYKKGNVEAIKKDEKIIEIPKTNKKDRKTLINEALKKKENIKNLTESKNEEEFKNISDGIFNENEEVKKTYQKHIMNDINDDRTWRKDDFIREMLKYIDSINREKIIPPQSIHQENPLGLNLYNLKNRR